MARMTPTDAGVDATGLMAMLDSLEARGDELHSLMVVRGGAVVAEGWWHPYSPSRPHLLYSLSKTVTALGAGIACAEGRLRLTDSIADLLGLDGADHDAFSSVSLHDALRMATGNRTDPVLDPTAGISIDEHSLRDLLLATPPEQQPGTIFTYNQLATWSVAAAIERAAGEPLIDYLRPRLLDPLGATEATWTDAGDGSAWGFSGLHLATESIAALGQLLLQRGEWRGVQLVPAEFIDAAASVQMPNDAAHRGPGMPPAADGALGYGYQIWMSQHGYRGDGAYGQCCLVLPEHDAVVAITASALDVQPLLDAVWTHVVPALGREGSPRADAELAARLEAAVMPAPVAGTLEAARVRASAGMQALAAQTAPASEQPAALAAAQTALEDAAARWAALATAPPLLGVHDGPAHTTGTRSRDLPSARFGGIGGLDLPSVHAATLDAAQDGWTLALETDDGEVTLAVGASSWHAGTWPSRYPVPFQSRGGWSDATFVAELRMIETPHVALLTIVDGVLDLAWREPTLNGPGVDWYGTP